MPEDEDKCFVGAYEVGIFNETTVQNGKSVVSEMQKIRVFFTSKRLQRYNQSAIHLLSLPKDYNDIINLQFICILRVHTSVFIKAIRFY